MTKSIIFLAVLMLPAFALSVSGQVQIEGWHVYPELKKCPDRVRANESFEVSVALPSVWTKEQIAEIKFDWKVTPGSITDGQGTANITVLSASDYNVVEVEVI